MTDNYQTNEDLAKLLRETLNRDGIESLSSQVTDNLNKWKSVYMKVAVTGNSGAGKSSLINALRGLDQSDENAAEEGVTETTKNVDSYSLSDNGRIVLFDLPGVGTGEQPVKSYLQKMDFNQYNFVIIVTSQRFTENDEVIIKELHRLKKPFYLVRSKMKADVKNQKRKQTREEVISTIRENCLTNLRKLGVTAEDIFLIDSHEHLDYELGILQVKIAKDAPGIVKTSLLLTFKNTSKEVIKAKVKELKDRARWVAIKAVISGAPGAHYLMNEEVVENEISFYKQKLGLDDESLSKACQALAVDMENLKKTILFIDLALSPDKMLQYWCTSKEKLDPKSLVLKLLFDGIEKGLKGFLCKYTKVYSILCNILDTLEKNSIEISENIVDKNRGSSSV